MSAKSIEMKIDVSELKSEEEKLVEKLTDFLKEKTGGEVSADGKVLLLKGEGEALSKKYIRVTLKKFLHKHDLTEYFRVIGNEVDMLTIKGRKLAEEE